MNLELKYKQINKPSRSGSPAESEENVKGYRNFGEKVLHEGKILDRVANMSRSDYIQMYRVRYTNNVDFVVMLKNGIAVCW